jgi:hypothetical protein
MAGRPGRRRCHLAAAQRAAGEARRRRPAVGFHTYGKSGARRRADVGGPSGDDGTTTGAEAALAGAARTRTSPDGTQAPPAPSAAAVLAERDQVGK